MGGGSIQVRYSGRLGHLHVRQCLYKLGGGPNYHNSKGKILTHLQG